MSASEQKAACERTRAVAKTASVCPRGRNHRIAQGCGPRASCHAGAHKVPRGETMPLAPIRWHISHPCRCAAHRRDENQVVPGRAAPSQTLPRAGETRFPPPPAQGLRPHLPGDVGEPGSPMFTLALEGGHPTPPPSEGRPGGGQHGATGFHIHSAPPHPLREGIRLLPPAGEVGRGACRAQSLICNGLDLNPIP